MVIDNGKVTYAENEPSIPNVTVSLSHLPFFPGIKLD